VSIVTVGGTSSKVGMATRACIIAHLNVRLVSTQSELYHIAAGSLFHGLDWVLSTIILDTGDHGVTIIVSA